MRVIQASENISRGDAISHYMTLIADILTQQGIENRMLSVHLDERVEGDILRPESYIQEEGDVILFHASIGGEMFDYLATLTCRRMMIYHNMTPPTFFKDFDDHIANLLEKGHEQLVAASSWVEKAYGVSDFNIKCLEEAGYTDVDKMPFAISFADFDAAKSDRLVKKMKQSDTFRLIFYGRIAPHKCQHDLIKLLAFYRKFYNKHAELYLIGSFNKEERYYLALEALIQELHLSGSVHIEGHVSYPDLVSTIHASDIFVGMSEHEGLFVPIVECFHAGVPVVAYGAGAIPETMGGEGVCIPNKSLVEFAEAIDHIERDQSFRGSLIDGQQRRASDFGTQHLKATIVSLLATL